GQVRATSWSCQGVRSRRPGRADRNLPGRLSGCLRALEQSRRTCRHSRSSVTVKTLLRTEGEPVNVLLDDDGSYASCSGIVGQADISEILLSVAGSGGPTLDPVDDI